MEGLKAWMAQLEFHGLIVMLLTAASCLVCITVHEVCHGLAALALGDPTAKRAGRLSVNPLKHIDPAGLVMMALLRFGWAKPVPVDMRWFKKPKLGMAVTALAGPVSNVALSALALLCYAVTEFYFQYLGFGWLEYVSLFFLYTASLSAGLAVFNLIPVPPLDGSKILFALLPDKGYLWLMKYERYGALVLAALLMLGVLDSPLGMMRGALLESLGLVCLWPFDLLVGIYF